MNVHYKELLDRAYYYHSKNKLNEAEEIYLQLLNINPDDINILNLIGMLYLSKNDPKNAIKYISKAFLLKKTSYLATNLAKAYFLNSQTDKAIKMYKTALQFGETDDLYYSMAIAYKRLKDFDNVIACYKKAIKLNPDNYNANYNLSLAYADIKDYDNAIKYAKICLKLKTDDIIFNQLSEFYQKKNMYNDAIDAEAKAITINPKKFIYHYNLGALYCRVMIKYTFDLYTLFLKISNLVDEKTLYIFILCFICIKSVFESKAVDSYKKSIILNQHYKKAYLNLSNLYKYQNELEKSADILELLILTNPDYINAYSILASTYMEMGYYDKALSNYDKAIEKTGETKELLNGKAVALKYLGRLEEAKDILSKLVDSNNCNTNSVVSLGAIYLSEKEFLKGYNLYRFRNIDTNLYKFYKDNIWNPQTDIKDKNILLYSNCGFGDTIMFCRYITYLKKSAKSVSIQTDKELVQLLKYNFKDIDIYEKGEKLKNFDVIMPFMDIQLALNMDFNSIPFSKGYLKSDRNKKIIESDKIKAGLFWKGSDKVLKNRSIPIEKIKDIICDERFFFYSFQLDDDEIDVNSLAIYINDFSDTARLLKQIDLLITIDSAIAHLAGALGVKTWLLLPYISEWRWFNDTENTPWYDSVKIFKQAKPDNWDDVIVRVKENLDLL